MNTKEAWTLVGGLSKPSKMPGWSIGLPAKECKTGGKLQKVEGSVCYNCYALKGDYFLSKAIVVPYGSSSGPAKTMAEDKPMKDTADYVYVIKCKGLPNVAKEWLCRKRTCGWPSKQLVKETANNPSCDICPAASQKSSKTRPGMAIWIY